MAGQDIEKKILGVSFLCPFHNAVTSLKTTFMYIYVCVYACICVFIHTHTSKCVFLGDSLTPQKLKKKTKVLEFSGWKVG